MSRSSGSTLSLRAISISSSVTSESRSGVGAPAISGPGGGASPAPVRGGTLTATFRSEPRSFNRLVSSSFATDIYTHLTQAQLVRVNRATSALEPWLAERWESDPDGRRFTLTLRDGVRWSDGEPFTSADVLFTFEAVFDARVKSSLVSSMSVGGRPLAVSAPDARTVVVTYPAPFGPGLRVLDNVPIPVQIALVSGQADHYDLEVTGPAQVLASFSGPPSRMRELRGLLQKGGLKEARETLAIMKTLAGEAGDIGAVLGLIHVMENLSNPDAIGPGIAVAFVATVYGVGAANLLFLPLANKIKLKIKAESHCRTMLITGLVGIASGENPRQLEEKLAGYVGGSHGEGEKKH